MDKKHSHFDNAQCDIYSTQTRPPQLIELKYDR